MLSRLFAKPEVRASYPAGYDPIWGYWPGDQIVTSSGANVTAESALQLLAVYGSVSLIADEISTLPVVVDNAPAWVEQPTTNLSRIGWLTQIVSSILLDGNSYLLVMRNPGSRDVVELLPLADSIVTVRMVAGVKRYYLNGQLTDLEIIHIPGMMRAGSLVGLSPVENARQTIGLGQSAAEYGARFFAGEGNMPGVIEAPRPMLPGKMKEVAELWQRKRAKGGRGLPGILDDGATWKATGVTHEQMQFLATRQFTDSQIVAMMFKLDPSDLGIATPGTSLTYANLAQRNTRRVQVTLLPIIRRIEHALSLYVIGGYRFNLDSRLRGDTRESYETLTVGLDGGFLQLDEVREILNLPIIASQPPSFNSQVEMVGQLVRAGFDPEASLKAVGLPSILHTGLVPITVTPLQTNSEELLAEIRASSSKPDLHVHAGPVNVSMPDIRIEPPAVTINVPEQPASVVNVRNDAPIVNVSVPETRAKSQRIEHDAEGRIVKVVTE